MKLLLEGSNCNNEDEGDFFDDLNYQFDFKGGCFKVEVKNFGWNNRSGVAYFKANKLTDLLVKMLPNTECNFKLYREKKILKLQNYHHDSPCGNEWYHIKKCAESTYEKNRR